MKKVMFIGAMLLCGLMMLPTPADAQSRKDKKKAEKADWEYQQRLKELERQRKLDSVANLATPQSEMFVDIPCYDKTLSQGEEDPYFRELGIGESMNRAQARLLAIDNANSMVKRRIGGVVKGLATDYSKNVSTKSSPAHLSQIIEQEYVTVIDKIIRDAAKPCEKMSRDRSGQWCCYYVIWVGRGELADKLADAVANNEEIQADFDREKFRKYAKEYLQNSEE